MKNQITFSEKLKALMRRHNMNIQDLSYKVKMPYGTIWKICRGEAKARRSTRVAIAVAFNLRPEYFED
jgi:predicted transcriptional regulator